MKAILWISTCLASFGAGGLIGRGEIDLLIMAVIAATVIGVLIGIVFAALTTRKPSRKVNAYIISEKREPVSVNHRLSGGQR